MAGQKHEGRSQSLAAIVLQVIDDRPKSRAKRGERFGNNGFYFHQIGGKKWEDYYTRIKTKLLATQKPTGEWSERLEANVGPQYQTAIAVLILSVPANYLPIYQR